MSNFHNVNDWSALLITDGHAGIEHCISVIHDINIKLDDMHVEIRETDFQSHDLDIEIHDTDAKIPDIQNR